MLLPWTWQLKKGKEAERVPVQVAVRAQFGLLLRWGIAWGEGEAQVVAHLYVKTVKKIKQQGLNHNQIQYSKTKCFIFLVWCDTL